MPEFNTIASNRTGWERFGDLFLGEPSQSGQFSTNTPQQSRFLNENILSILPQLLQQTQQRSQGGFEPIRQSAIANFNSQTIPSLAERFTAMGNNRNSGGFQGALGAAGAGLQRDLSALESQYNLQQGGQQQNLLLSLLGLFLRPQFENTFMPAGQGIFHGFSQGLGQGLGGYAAGGIGSGVSAASNALSAALAPASSAK